MDFFLNRYLTEYDENLSGDSYIDPIGTLTIWSAFGRQVFSNRINSISNDVRNYTLNLLHHFLIRKLVNDDAIELSPALRRRYSSKDSLSFKHACLIFLENLYVYSILCHKDGPGVDDSGVLGISKARRNWEASNGNPILQFTHEASGQILVRQLGLGVSGRYKSPLMDIGFFDTSYNYNKPSSNTVWGAAELFITAKRNKLISGLADIAYTFLTVCVATRSHSFKLQFAHDVPHKLTESYARAFASPQIVGAYAREFWLERTQLNSGAAGALFNVLETDIEGELDAKQVLENALQMTLDPGERAKLENIVQLEPFLSDCALMFSLMTSERTHTVSDVIRHWKRFGRNERRLPVLAKQVKDHTRLPSIKGSTAAYRLTQLYNAANAGGMDLQIHQLAKYHADVMQSRGQLSWLTVQEDGGIKVDARTSRRPDPGTWEPGTWHNDYYLPQFRSFVTGLQGANA